MKLIALSACTISDAVLRFLTENLRDYLEIFLDMGVIKNF